MSGQDSLRCRSWCRGREDWYGRDFGAGSGSGVDATTARGRCNYILKLMLCVRRILITCDEQPQPTLYPPSNGPTVRNGDWESGIQTSGINISMKVNRKVLDATWGSAYYLASGKHSAAVLLCLLEACSSKLRADVSTLSAIARRNQTHAGSLVVKSCKAGYPLDLTNGQE